MNNAGVIQSGPLADFAERDWDRIFAVNVKGIFLLSQAALPHLKARGGHIINIASVAGKQGFPEMGVYCASKFAAISLTQSMAAELAEYDIRVNAICPGNVDTSMWYDHLSASERLQRRYGTDNVEDTFRRSKPRYNSLGSRADARRYGGSGALSDARRQRNRNIACGRWRLYNELDAQS